MEISLREWLIIGGILVIALILFDGWRRIRASRNRLKIDIDKSLSELGETSHHNPELPNGGARVRKYDQEPFFSETSLETELLSDVPKPKPVQKPASKLSKVAGKFASSSSVHSSAVHSNNRQEPEFNLHANDEPELDPIELQSAMLDQDGIKAEPVEADIIQTSVADDGVVNQDSALEQVVEDKTLNEEVVFEKPVDEQPLYQQTIVEDSPLEDSPLEDLPLEESLTVEVTEKADVESEQPTIMSEVSTDEDKEAFEQVPPFEMSEEVFEEVQAEAPEETRPLYAERETESSLVKPELQASEPQDLAWDPELEKQFDQMDPSKEPSIKVDQPISEPKRVAQNFADLDPLFDDIPTDPLPPVKSKDSSVRTDSSVSKGPEKDSGKDEPNLFLDLDLDQPIHQLMANKAAETKAVNREAARRSKDKPAAREEYKSLSLPLEPDLERQLESTPEATSEPTSVPKLEPELDDLFADFDGVNPLEEVSVDPIRKTAVKSDTYIPNVEKPTEKPIEKSKVDFQAKTQSDKQAEIKASSNAQDLEKSRSAATAARKALSDLPDPEEVLVITVVGKNRQHLDGARLQRVVEACGMEHGDMSIYHRFDGTGAAASLQFSMANAVNPGTFDPNAMDALETPAVSFFMSMREPRDAMTAYECMLATAETLAKNIDGDLLDEDRSVMREQTKEHYRQRIRDFEMQTRRRNLTR